MAEKRRKTKVATICAVLALVVVLASCGDTERETLNGEEIRLDSETDRKVSTFVIEGDSFTLPCDLSEFLEKGYSLLTENGTPVDPDGMMLTGKSDIHTLYVSRDGSGMTGIAVANPDAGTKILRNCTVLSISYDYRSSLIGGSLAWNWSYMGLTLESFPEDVAKAFDGILELETNEWKDMASLTMRHYDKYRTISIDFDETDGGYEMQSIYVIFYPTDEKFKTYISIH